MYLTHQIRLRHLGTGADWGWHWHSSVNCLPTCGSCRLIQAGKDSAVHRYLKLIPLLFTNVWLLGLSLCAACRCWLQHLWGPAQTGGVAQSGGGSCGEGSLPRSAWKDLECPGFEEYPDWPPNEGANETPAAEDAEVGGNMQRSFAARLFWMFF